MDKRKRIEGQTMIYKTLHISEENFVMDSTLLN